MQRVLLSAIVLFFISFCNDSKKQQPTVATSDSATAAVKKNNQNPSMPSNKI